MSARGKTVRENRRAPEPPISKRPSTFAPVLSHSAMLIEMAYGWNFRKLDLFQKLEKHAQTTKRSYLPLHPM
ncbi:MAG: hypothetical protein A3K09_04145 [Nitrospinae bacterium RIFCSPLOWO2_12_FULL_47_7]|nr:MAG: hypothetical protein A3K09_04145 [Nitrospinae bacterium RIFCSPLOWO2_12_FULL_47_7]